jgi:hypothetical protein
VARERLDELALLVGEVGELGAAAVVDRPPAFATVNAR